MTLPIVYSHTADDVSLSISEVHCRSSILEAAKAVKIRRVNYGFARTGTGT